MAIISKNPHGDADTKNHQTFISLVKVLAGQAAADAMADLTPANDNKRCKADSDGSLCLSENTQIAPQD